MRAGRVPAGGCAAARCVTAKERLFAAGHRARRTLVASGLRRKRDPMGARPQRASPGPAHHRRRLDSGEHPAHSARAMGRARHADVLHPLPELARCRADRDRPRRPSLRDARPGAHPLDPRRWRRSPLCCGRFLRRASASTAPASRSIFQGATRWNTTVAIAIAGFLYGAHGRGADVGCHRGDDSAPERALRQRALLVRRGVDTVAQAHRAWSSCKNPLILACAAGIALNLGGVASPRRRDGGAEAHG